MIFKIGMFDFGSKILGKLTKNDGYMGTHVYTIHIQNQNFISKEVKFTWKMRNVLNRKKNHFSDFYFSSYGHFCDVIDPIFDKFSR